MKLKTIREAAQLLGVSEGSLRSAVRRGALPVLLLGNRQLVDVDAAREVMSAQAGATIDEVSEATGLSRSAIYRSVREGWMPCRKIGKRLHFDMDAVQAAILARMQEQTSQQ